MAIMKDRRPDYHGEAKVWDCLGAFLPENVIVYNGREINGREFDFCVLLENMGVLIIEVKGWLRDKITVRGVDDILVEGYDQPQRSPKKQARAYRFGFLNYARETYNVSPLVFDMVCYPFITRAEYLDARLDIISEEQFTIFKDDLVDRDTLINKINWAYSYSKAIPHTELTPELLRKLSGKWSPNMSEPVSNFGTVPYSALSVFVNGPENREIDEIINHYFHGEKQVLFLGSIATYNAVADAFNQAFKQRNIQPDGSNLSVGIGSGLNVGKSSIRTFNLEVYLVEDLLSSDIPEFRIEEGNLSGNELVWLNELAEKTTFNLQQYLVEHADSEKNILVEAGAGTGKTYSMVSRIAFLCNKLNGAIANLADELAMVTFTNDAANNMKIRLKKMFVNYFILTGNPKYLKFVEDINLSHISTIHSFAMEILREQTLYTGLGTTFRIASNEDLRGKIYDAFLGEFLQKQEDENPNFANEIPVPVYDLKKKAMAIADRLLQKSVNLGRIKPEEMGIPEYNSLPYLNELIRDVVIPSEEQYSAEMHSANSMDLKECIILLEQVLRQLPGKLESLRLRYLFIDEFQDTDDVQIQVFQLLQKAINAECKMFVVGDLKQSIYRFKGANLSAFTQMMSACLYEWDIFHLNTNYRTDHRLLDLFDAVFSEMGEQNYLPYLAENDRLTSRVLSDAADEDLFVCVPCHGKDEGKFNEAFITVVKEQMSKVSQLIHERAEKGLSPLSKEERTIAVLVRSNWQVDKLVTAAKKESIRIDTKSGGDLFQLDSTLDLYKLTLALFNPANPLYLINLIESNYTGMKLNYQVYHGMPREEITADLRRILDEFFTLRMEMNWQQLINETNTQPILFVLKQIYDALMPWKQYSYDQAEQKYYMANYEYLMERIIRYNRTDALTLNQIMDYLKISIVTGQQQLSREIDIDEDGVQVLCTTIHKSKGLEYGTVILPYTYSDIRDLRSEKLSATYSERKLAYTVTFENDVTERNSNYDEHVAADEQVAEESRILYVALTRAIRNCVWIHNVDASPTISWGTLMEG